MAEYVILLPGNEDQWEAATEERRRAEYDRHNEFAKLLEERGHRIVGGHELTHSRTARVVRGGLDDVTVTEGPYAETVEQLTGFYVVDTDDPEGLYQVCGILAGDTGVEIRSTVDHSGDVS